MVTLYSTKVGTANALKRGAATAKSFHVSENFRGHRLPDDY